MVWERSHEAMPAKLAPPLNNASKPSKPRARKAESGQALGQGHGQGQEKKVARGGGTAGGVRSAGAAEDQGQQGPL